MVLLRLIIKPQRQLMHVLLLMGSNAFEQQQQALLAKTVGPEQPVGFHREYRAFIAAQGVLETKVVETITGLMTDPNLWECLPLVARTSTRRSHVFAALSMTLSLVHEMLVRSSTYPLKLFLCLLKPGLEAEILSGSCQ